MLGLALIAMASWALIANRPTGQRFAEGLAVRSQQPAAKPVLLVIGDSGTAGTGMNTRGREWAALVAEQLGWQLELDAISGTGYIADGTSVRFSGRLAADAERSDPDLIVLAGGSNDLLAGQPPSSITEAAGETLTRAQEVFPGIPVVLFSAWAPGDPSSVHLTLTEDLQRLARERGVPFLDVSWFTVGGPGVLGSDGMHPTDQGHRLIAFRVIDSGVLQRAMLRS